MTMDVQKMTRREVLAALSAAGISTAAATDRVLAAVREVKGTPLLQLHRQQVCPRTLKTEFVAQKECGSYEEFATWFKDVASRRKLPYGWEWLVCDETADCFMKKPV